MSFPAPSIHGVRVVGVGDTMTYDIPLDADVMVLEGYTLVCTRQGTVHRLVAVGDEVREAPMSAEQRAHVLELFER